MVIHNTQMSTSPAGKTQRAVSREDQTQRKPRENPEVVREEHRKLAVRGRPGKENKNTEFPSLPAPGSVSPPCSPVTGEQ